MLKRSKVHSGRQAHRPTCSAKNLGVVAEDDVASGFESQVTAGVADAGALIQIPKRPLIQQDITAGFQVNLGEADESGINIQMQRLRIVAGLDSPRPGAV